ncbi:MAG: putative DNA binding domain-containing protein [Opitutaceae bacterium]|jgi:predicted HTH transcriptional regulator|nr:putative DNA binding domain-containing protein [Opitutaceae bacterium]
MNTESNRVEFKLKLTDKFERSVVAFLNYAGGGEILLGIDDNGSIAGLADAAGDQLKIVDRIKNNIRPATLGLFDVIREQRDGRDIIRVVVSGGLQRPYYIREKGMSETGCFIRVGNSVQPMPGQMIEDLLAKRHPVSLQTTPSPRRNLSFGQLKIYYQEHGFEITSEFLGNLDLLLPSGEYNYAAYMLADNNGVSMKVAKYAGTDKYDLVENYEYGNCCLLTATNRILERLLVENKTFAKISYPTRLEKNMVDKTALREAVINAIVHNDYSLTVPLVEIYSDRIVVTSAGGLVEGLSQDDFFNCRSMPRNRVLMRVFRDAELVESLGSGMTRILRAYDRSIFNFTPSFLEITFPFDADYKASDGTDGIGAGQATPQDNLRDENLLREFDAVLALSAPQATPQATPQVAKQVVKILRAASESAEREALQVATDITNRKHFRKAYLEPLVSAGWLERTIPNKPTSPNQQYRITEKGRAWLGKVEGKI